MNTFEGNRELSKKAHICYSNLINAFEENDIQSAIFGEPDIQIAIVKNAILQHKNHIKIHNISQTNLDFYKFVCWLGCELLTIYKNNTQAAENEQSREIIISIVNVLVEYFKIDTQIYLNDESFKFIVDLLNNEYKGQGKHGIWMNGLYLCFHVALEGHKVQKQCA